MTRTPVGLSRTLRWGVNCTSWCASSWTLSWCKYNSNFTILFMVDISNYLLWFINQQTSLRGAPNCIILLWSGKDLHGGKGPQSSRCSRWSTVCWSCHRGPKPITGFHRKKWDKSNEKATSKRLIIHIFKKHFFFNCGTNNGKSNYIQCRFQPLSGMV